MFRVGFMMPCGLCYDKTWITLAQHCNITTAAVTDVCGNQCSTESGIN